MKENNLTYDEKELFNSEILQQYDNDGQRGFLGYLIRHEKWTIEGGEIIFPDVKSEEIIQKLLKDYDTDVKKSNLQIMKQDLRNVSVFGLASLEHTIERIEKEIKENKQETKQVFTEYQNNKIDEIIEKNSNYFPNFRYRCKMYRGEDAIKFLEDLGVRNACSMTLSKIEAVSVPVTVIYMGKDKKDEEIYKFYYAENNMISISKEDLMNGTHILSSYKDMEKAMILHKSLRMHEREKNKDCR